LDYSKWDDIDPEDSEEEEALENRRLDIAEDDQEMADFKAKIAIEQAPKIEVIEPPTPIAVPKPDTVTTGAITRSELVACFTDSGGSVPSGVDEVRYMWSQTETEVAVAFVVPDSTRAKSVVLTQTAPDASGFDRTAPGARLLITVRTRCIILPPSLSFSLPPPHRYVRIQYTRTLKGIQRQAHTLRHTEKYIEEYT
jgi:hypothetical protein